MISTILHNYEEIKNSFLIKKQRNTCLYSAVLESLFYGNKPIIMLKEGTLTPM